MRRWMPNNASVSTLLKPLAGMLMLLPLANCTTLGNATERLPVDTSCGAFRALTYSSKDTDETKTEIRAHNRVYDALCPAS